jgi:hypothetical protein
MLLAATLLSFDPTPETNDLGPPMDSRLAI